MERFINGNYNHLIIIFSTNSKNKFNDILNSFHDVLFTEKQMCLPLKLKKCIYIYIVIKELIGIKFWKEAKIMLKKKPSLSN